VTCGQVAVALTGVAQIATAITGPSQIPVAITSSAQGYGYVECCNVLTPATPVQIVTWIPIDEELKAAALNPWDGASFIGPADVFGVIVQAGGGGGGGGSFSGGSQLDPPIQGSITDGGGDQIVPF